MAIGLSQDSHQNIVCILLLFGVSKVLGFQYIIPHQASKKVSSL